MKWIDGPPTLDGIYLVRNVGETYPVLVAVSDLLLFVTTGNVCDVNMRFVGHMATLRLCDPMEHARFKVQP